MKPKRPLPTPWPSTTEQAIERTKNHIRELTRRGERFQVWHEQRLLQEMQLVGKPRQISQDMALRNRWR